MTPTAAKPGESVVPKTSTKTCVSVVAPACEYTPTTTLGGVLDTTTYYMTYTSDSQYTMNAWCDIDSTTFDLTYQYFDYPWTQVENPAVWTASLVDNQTYVEVWSERESDYELDVKFSIAYNASVFTT